MSVPVIILTMHLIDFQTAGRVVVFSCPLSVWYVQHEAKPHLASVIPFIHTENIKGDCIFFFSPYFLS